MIALLGSAFRRHALAVAAAGFLVATLLPLPARAWMQTTTCESLCTNTCSTANDGICQDGGAGATSGDCELGTDCMDCGFRAAPGSSGSHCLPGEIPLPARWCSACVPYHIQQGLVTGIADEDAIAEAIERAFDTWNAVECSSFHAVYAGRTDENRTGYAPCGDNINFVGFINEGWGRRRYPPAALALTSVTMDLTDGVIVDADIELNGNNFMFRIFDEPLPQSTDHDLQNVMTHEVGHFLGLDHAHPDNHQGDGTWRDATMMDSSPPADLSMRVLHADDIAGICTIYPEDDSWASVACELPAFGFKPAPADVPGAACSPILATPVCPAPGSTGGGGNGPQDRFEHKGKKGCSQSGAPLPSPLLLFLVLLPLFWERRNTNP